MIKCEVASWFTEAPAAIPSLVPLSGLIFDDIGHLQGTSAGDSDGRTVFQVTP
jgi:hypothetical protein